MQTLATISANTLLKTLKPLAKTISSRSSVEALKCVLLSADRATTTDMTARLEIVTGVHCDDVLVPYAKLCKVLSAYGKQDVSLAVADCNLTISAGASKTIVPGIDADDFPRDREVSGPYIGLANGKMDAIRDVARFVSSDESRPTFTGVHVECADGLVDVTATDSYVLGHDSFASACTDTVSALFPPIALDAIGPFATMIIGKDHVRFSDDNGTRLTIMRLASDPVRWRQLVPKQVNSIVTLHAGDLEGFLKMVGKLATGSGTNPCAFTFGSLGVEAAWASDGLVHGASIESSGDCEELTIGLNCQYAKLCTDYAGTTAGLISPLRPVVWWGDIEGRWALQMPVRLSY